MTDSADPANLNADANETIPATPPTIKDPSSFLALSTLSAFEHGANPKTASRAYRDPKGDFWIANSDDSNMRRIECSEALMLTNFLTEQFGLHVINEPAQWGNETQQCECSHVPERVSCSDCGAELYTGSGGWGDLTPWATDESMTLF